MEKIICGLCEGRHLIPNLTHGYIFPSVVDPTDTTGLREQFSKWYDLRGEIDQVYDVALNQADYETIRVYRGVPVVLYVTGCTPALTAVIAVCIVNGIPLTLMHYNRETGTYFPETVVA